MAPKTEFAEYLTKELKGATKKKTGWHFLNNFYSFRKFTVMFSGDLGFEERLYHVKFFWPDILQKKPDIQPDIKKAGYPVQL